MKAIEDTTEEAEDDAALHELEDDTNEETAENAEDEIDASVAESDAALVDAVAAEVDEQSDLPMLTHADINLGKFAMAKVNHIVSALYGLHSITLCQLQNLAKQIFNGPTICANLEAACIKSKIKPLLMVCDVATQWNSTAELLGRALQLHEALNLLVISEQHNQPRSACLKCFQSSKQEWDLLDKLFQLLEASFIDITPCHSC